MFVDFTIVFYTVKLTIKCRIKKSYPYLRLVSITPQIFACNIYLPFLGKYLFIKRSNVLNHEEDITVTPGWAKK